LSQLLPFVESVDQPAGGVASKNAKMPEGMDVVALAFPKTTPINEGLFVLAVRADAAAMVWV
jgi:hypothetical protein